MNCPTCKHPAHDGEVCHVQEEMTIHYATGPNPGMHGTGQFQTCLCGLWEMIEARRAACVEANNDSVS
jgi:hypothetical protein